MRYVLDSNGAVKWVLEENLSDKARRIRDEFAQGVHELLAPDVFLAEVAHALTRAQRQGRITPLEVDLFMADLLTTLTAGELPARGTASWPSSRDRPMGRTKIRLATTAMHVLSTLSCQPCRPCRLRSACPAPCSRRKSHAYPSCGRSRSARSDDSRRASLDELPTVDRARGLTSVGPVAAEEEIPAVWIKR
jgi:predicted nucleic acid-binding protein